MSSKSILIFAFFIVAIVSIVISFNDDSRPKVIPNIPTTKISIEENNDIEVLYLVEDENKTQTKIQLNQIDKQISTKYLNEEINENIQDLQYEKAEEYIKKKKLHNITSVTKTSDQDSPRFSVYSDISTEEAKNNQNKDLPPLSPVILNGTLNSGQTYTVIIDGNVKNQAKEIVITDNDPSGNIIEAINVPIDNGKDKEPEEDNNNVFIAPPSIGQ